MKIVTVKCESCGAALKIDDESSVFTCEYCGTSLKLLRKETPQTPDPPPPARSASANFSYQIPNYYTQVVNDIKTGVKHVARFTRPFWIITFITIFVAVALSVIIPLAVTSTGGTTPGGNNGTSGGNNGTSDKTQLPSNPMVPLIYDGAGDKVVNGIKLPKGNYYTKLTHDGSRNFIVRFYYGNGQYEYISLANKIGVYTGYSLLDDILGEAVTEGTLDIKADGNWTITIYEISETSGASVSEKGDYVTGVISGLSGRKTVTMTHNGSRNFIVRIYTYNAGKYGYTPAANKIGAYTGQISASFSSGSKYYFSVQADGGWTISVS